MKIKIKLGKGTTRRAHGIAGTGEGELIVDTCHPPKFEDCFNGLVIETDQGRFGIAQRDDGIEVLLGGTLVWSSTSAMGNAPVSDEAKSAAWRSCLTVTRRAELFDELELKLKQIEAAAGPVDRRGEMLAERWMEAGMLFERLRGVPEPTTGKAEMTPADLPRTDSYDGSGVPGYNPGDG